MLMVVNPVASQQEISVRIKIPSPHVDVGCVVFSGFIPQSGREYECGCVCHLLALVFCPLHAGIWLQLPVILNRRGFLENRLMGSQLHILKKKELMHQLGINSQQSCERYNSFYRAQKIGTGH